LFATTLARIRRERALDFDAITVGGHVRALARLAEDSKRRGVPGHVVTLRARARLVERVSDGRVIRQLHVP